MALSLEQYKSRWTKSHKIKDILMERLNRQREVSSVVSIKNADCIPEHLIIEILSWLPVEVLLRFKTVCKLWYSIIKSSYFISKHLKNYYDNNNSPDCLLVQYHVTQAGEINVYELLVDDMSDEVLSSYQEIDTPFYNTNICGPCDGLYFLWEIYSEPRRILWNPALNEFARLPDMIPKPNLPSYMSASRRTYGFGFDSMTKDYKVIVIENYRDKRSEDYYTNYDYPPSLFIYSLESNSWRYWGDLNIHCRLEETGNMFLRGCHYWLGSYGYCSWHYKVMLSFDINTEVYEKIQLPTFEKECGFGGSGSKLIIFHDSVGFLFFPKEEKETNFCIWTWSEGVWTQKLTMDVGFPVWGAFSHWRDNIIVFRVAYGSLVLCDTDTSEVWELDDPRAGHAVFNIVVYRESLVSIKKLVVYNEKLELKKDVEIPEWFWQ